MHPLPPAPYELATWSTAKIHNDYTITDGLNRYSVPFDLIGETVDIRTTRDKLGIIFCGHEQIITGSQEFICFAFVFTKTGGAVRTGSALDAIPAVRAAAAGFTVTAVIFIRDLTGDGRSCRKTALMFQKMTGF